MKYENTIEGKFIDRPNRFIAHVQIDDVIHTVHVKNTGRCKELLLPGVRVNLQDCMNENRKTRYDLILKHLIRWLRNGLRGRKLQV